MVVAEGQAQIASEHNFNIENLIPSVTHFMNITSDAGDSLRRGGEEGGVCVYVLVHDATFDPLTGVNHAAKLLHVMRTIMGTNELSYIFYLFGLDTYGSINHKYKHVQNQLALFAFSLLRNMNKFNVTRG